MRQPEGLIVPGSPSSRDNPTFHISVYVVEVLYRLWPVLCIGALLFAVVNWMAGCASTVRTTPAAARVSETTRLPDGTVKVREASSTSASGAATGDKTNLVTTTTAPTVTLNSAGGGTAAGGDADSSIAAKVSGLSLFLWAAVLCGIGAVALLACKQVRLGMWAGLLAAVFGLCAWNPLCLLGVAAVALFSLYHTGRSFEGLRAVIASAKGLHQWDAIKDGLHEHADLGDHAAVKAAEKAET